MKKIIILSMISSSMLLAGINVAVLGKSHGGTKNEVDAIKDGIGYIVTKPTNGNAIIDNSAYNAALYQYADKVTYTGTTDFKDYINSTNTIPASVKASVVDNTSVATLAKINTLRANDPTLHSTGSSCDDHDSFTSNDVYTSSGVCIGSRVDGALCDDSNAATTGETWLNNVCQGGIPNIVSPIYSASSIAANTSVDSGITQASLFSRGFILKGTFTFAAGGLVEGGLGLHGGVYAYHGIYLQTDGINIGFGWGTGTGYSASGPIPFTPNIPFDLIIYYNNGISKIYVNNILTNSFSASPGLAYTTGSDLILGNSYGTKYMNKAITNLQIGYIN